MYDIWNSYSRIAEEVYQKDNYKIVLNSSGGGYVFICFSSNAIWHPEEEVSFRKSFIDNDRYEWTTINNKLASKIIYVRDIYKSWYVTGINKRIDSIDKLVEVLATMVGEMPLVCVGCSSGGYIATLIGTLLRAKHVIAFSAQFDLRNKWALESNSFLRKYADEDEKSKWYNLRPLLESSKVPIYYIVPIRTEQDRHQTRQIKSIESVKPIMFYSKRHGTVVLKDNLNVLISLSTDEWERIYEQYRGKKVLPIIFSLRIDGFWGTIVDIVKHIQRVIKRKLSNLRK